MNHPISKKAYFTMCYALEYNSLLYTHCKFSAPKPDIYLHSVHMFGSPYFFLLNLHNTLVLKFTLKYTNPASRHSWLLQAKVVSPSYEANEPSKEWWILCWLIYVWTAHVCKSCPGFFWKHDAIKCKEVLRNNMTSYGNKA